MTLKSWFFCSKSNLSLQCKLCSPAPELMTLISCFLMNQIHWYNGVLFNESNHSTTSVVWLPDKFDYSNISIQHMVQLYPKQKSWFFVENQNHTEQTEFPNLEFLEYCLFLMNQIHPYNVTVVLQLIPEQMVLLSASKTYRTTSVIQLPN